MEINAGGSTPEHMGEIAHLRLLPSVAGSIELGRLRASGSMGTVYDVEDIGLKEKRKMVIKIFAPKAKRVAKMAKEVANCVRAKDMVPSGTIELVGFTEELKGVNGSCAIVFIDGGRDLADIMVTEDDKAWASYMKQTLCIVMALHRKGISHGDVKPRNLVVDDEGKVTLIDFGSATFADERISSMMSTIVGISLPGFDGTQDGFISDAYSCAVSFGEKYGLSVNGITGARVPTIDELEENLSASNLISVLCGLTAKALERWDIEKLQASAWWNEIGDDFCVQIPGITNAEKSQSQSKEERGVFLGMTYGPEGSPSAAAAAGVEKSSPEGYKRVGRKRSCGGTTSSITPESPPAPRCGGEGGGNPSAAAKVGGNSPEGYKRVGRKRPCEGTTSSTTSESPLAWRCGGERGEKPSAAAEVRENSPEGYKRVARKRPRGGTSSIAEQDSPPAWRGGGEGGGSPSAEAAAVEALLQPAPAAMQLTDEGGMVFKLGDIVASFGR